MTNAFHFERNDNFFGNTEHSIEDALRSFPLDSKETGGRRAFDGANSLLRKVYRSRWLPLRFRRRLWHVARRTELDQTWFIPFAKYWTSVLGGRPLWGVQDFYFLRSYYRLAFQNLRIPDKASAREHALAFQRPEALYFLFQQIYREKISNHAGLVARALKRGPRRISAFLEYGCGTAPIATSLFEFFPENSSIRVHLADLIALPLQYAAYKFRCYPNVSVHPLLAENNLQMVDPVTVDVIFCLNVFEHLNDPMVTVKKFHDNLNSGGLLVFDYIQGDAQGLDSLAGLEQRNDVLSFIEQNFRIVEGEIEKGRSTGEVICQKIA